MNINNKNGFQHIVSLGYNCEVSYRIKDYIRTGIDSYPLSWAYMKKQNELVHILDTIDSCYTSKLTIEDSGMFYCEDLNISLHTTVPHKKVSEYSEDEKQEYVIQGEREIKERFKYLCEKWHRLLESNESTLFVLKLCSRKSLKYYVSLIRGLDEWLSKNYVSQKYYVACFFDDNEMLEETRQWIESEHIGFCNIDCFAPDGETLSGGHKIGWIKGIEFFNHMFDEINNVGTKQREDKDFYTISEEEYWELRNWCQELTAARDWFVETLKRRDDEIEKLKSKEEKMNLEDEASE